MPSGHGFAGQCEVSGLAFGELATAISLRKLEVTSGDADVSIADAREEAFAQHSLVSDNNDGVPCAVCSCLLRVVQTAANPVIAPKATITIFIPVFIEVPPLRFEIDYLWQDTPAGELAQGIDDAGQVGNTFALLFQIYRDPAAQRRFVQRLVELAEVRFAVVSTVACLLSEYA